MSPSFHVPPGVPITLTKSVEKREETTRNRPQRGLKGVCRSSLLLHEMSVKRNCGAYKCRSAYWALNYILRTLPRTMETNSAILMQAATAHERQKPQGNYMLTRMHVQHKSALRLSRDPSSSRLIIFHYLKLEKEPTWVSRIATWDSIPIIFEDRVSSWVLQIAKDYQLTLYCNKVSKRGCILSNFCKERLLWCCDVM